MQLSLPHLFLSDVIVCAGQARGLVHHQQADQRARLKHIQTQSDLVSRPGLIGTPSKAHLADTAFCHIQQHKYARDIIWVI